MGTTLTFSTPQTVYVGLGVSSGSLTALAVATFDNVSITAGSSLPNPVVMGIAPTAGAPGTTVTITARTEVRRPNTVTLRLSSVLGFKAL